MTFNMAKYSSMLHYIIEKCGNLSNVGKTVIWKILYFSEFDYYELHEKPISGEIFSKLERGPAPRHFDEVIESLKKNKLIKVTKDKFCNHNQYRYSSLKSTDLSKFSANEIKEIDRVISKLSSMTAKQISAYSHQDMPWKSAKINENLDYEMVFYRDDVMSVREYDECAKE